MAIKNSSVNLDITVLSDGYYASGGTTRRKLQITGSDVTFTGASRQLVYCGDTFLFPDLSTSDTLVVLDLSQTLTNKTLSTGTVISAATMTLGSDATGDIYYRAAGGLLTRLAIGTAGHVLAVSSGLPAYVSLATLITGTNSATFTIDADAGINGVQLGSTGGSGVLSVKLGDGSAYAQVDAGRVNAYGTGIVLYAQDDAQIAGDLTVDGDLTVNGTTTTINTETLVVEDKNIVIANVTTPTDITADGGGITIKGDTDKTFTWDNATDSFDSSEHMNLVTGKSYRINDVVVLSSTALGSGVVGSSLTSVGTLTTGTWQASVIAMQFGGSGKNLTPVAGGIVYTDADSMEVLGAGVSGQVLVSNGSSAPSWASPDYAAPVWEVITGTSHTVDSSDTQLKHIADNVALVTFSVDSSFPVGRELEVAGFGAGGWRIQMHTGGIVHFGNVSCAAGGYIESTHAKDAVRIVKKAANDYLVVSAVGNLNLSE